MDGFPVGTRLEPRRQVKHMHLNPRRGPHLCHPQGGRHGRLSGQSRVVSPGIILISLGRMSLAVLEREQGGADGGRRRGGGWGGCQKEEELRFRDRRHLYSSKGGKEVRHGHGARREHRQDRGRGSAITERVL